MKTLSQNTTVRSNSRKNTRRGFLQMIIILIVWLLVLLNNANAQTLNFSGSGQTGISGTNWNTSGTNPVTINITGTANINVSVIVGYLNAGTSVIVNNTATGTGINANINKSSGDAATLTFKDISHIKMGNNINISSTSSAMNIIFWADSDLSQGGTVDDFIFLAAGSTIESNGGKIVLAGGPDNR